MTATAMQTAFAAFDAYNEIERVALAHNAEEEGRQRASGVVTAGRAAHRYHTGAVRAAMEAEALILANPAVFGPHRS